MLTIVLTYERASTSLPQRSPESHGSLGQATPYSWEGAAPGNRDQTQHMSGRLAGKIAYVTAAGQGIGRATAVAFADEGARVWATDINESLLSALNQEHPNIQTRRLDVREGDAVVSCAAQIDTIDVLFNCAGYVHHGTILDCSEQDWDLSFDINVKSMYRTCHAFL